MPERLTSLRDHRSQVITRLSDGYAADLFEVEELERRLDLAHAARSIAELDALVADLGPARATSSALVPTSGSLVVHDPSRPLLKKQRVIMGHVERTGRWTVPQTLQLRVLWGNAELDFREASLAPGLTTLDLSVWMGNVELVLPPQLAIDVDVSSLLGSVEERHRVPEDDDPGRPVLRVTGAVRFGSLHVSTRLPRESEREARRRHKRERKADKHAARPALEEYRDRRRDDDDDDDDHRDEDRRDLGARLVDALRDRPRRRSRRDT